MYQPRIVTLVVTMVATLFCCVLIAHAQPTSEDKSNANSKKEEIDEKEVAELDERRTFDFSLPGDNRTQSLDLFFELPFDAPPLEFKAIEGKLSGNYFLTFQKPPNPPKNLSFLKSLQQEYTKMKAISESYTLHLEVSTPGKLGVGGYIEIEGDMSIETDPRLHTTLYGEYIPWRF